MARNIISFYLKQSEATCVYQNGYFDGQLAKSVILNEGDTVIYDIATLDTQKLDAQTVVFDEDTDFTASFVYFENNTDFTDKTAIDGPGGVDNELYVLYHKDTVTSEVNPVIGTATLTFPAGSYTPARLSEYISNQWSAARRLVSSTSKDPGNNLLIPSDFGTGGGSAKSMNNIDWGTSPYPYAAIVALSGPVTSWGPNADDGTAFYLGDGSEEGPNEVRGGGWVSLAAGVSTPVGITSLSDSDYHISSSGTNGSGSGLSIKIQPVGGNDIGWYGPNWDIGDVPSAGNQIYYSIVDGGQGYQRGDEVYFSSESFAYVFSDSAGSATFQRCPSGGTLTLVIESISDGSAYNFFVKVGDDPQNPSNSYRYNNPYLIGASEVAFGFNDDDNEAFSIDYLHTPYYISENNQPLEPAVKLLFNDASQLWNTLDVDSGICLVSVGPSSVWADTMSFDLDELLLKDANGEAITTRTTAAISSLEGYYTRGYSGSNSFLNTNATGPAARKIQSQSSITSTTLTVPIVANQYKTNVGSSYFDVTIGGFGGNETITSKRVMVGSAPVFKQYVSADTVSAGPNFGKAYVHQGEPLLVSKWSVMVKDPDTDDIAQDLGPNNTLVVYIVPGQPTVKAQART